jgi:hypothetical protein
LNRLITRFARAATLARRYILTRSHSDHSRDHSVDLETCTAEVSSNDRAATDCSVKDTVRKDPAVHVSLSSDSLVKQPGTKAAPSPDRPESRRSPNRRPKSEAGHRISVRSFGGAPSHRGGGAPCGAYIGWPHRRCQHPLGGILPVRSRSADMMPRCGNSRARPRGRPEGTRRQAAALEPHSSVEVTGLGAGLGYGHLWRPWGPRMRPWGPRVDGGGAACECRV